MQKSFQIKYLEAILSVGWLTLFIEDTCIDISRSSKSVRSRTLLEMCNQGTDYKLQFIKWKSVEKRLQCCCVEKNNKIGKCSKWDYQVVHPRWCWVRCFAGKWAACQIGAKSELSGDYSSALLTTGGAEWASITLERRVWFGLALLGTDQKPNNAPLATQNPALKWVRLCITYNNCVSIKGWQVYTNYPDNKQSMHNIICWTPIGCLKHPNPV